MTTTPKAFISYSHDSDQHADRVRALADWLASNGVEVELDQYHQHSPPPKGWNLWAEAQVATSQFVLLICTETYLRRYRKEENPGQGPGATYEAAIIRDALTRGSLRSGQIFALVFSPADVEFIPPPLRDTHYLVFDGDEPRDALLRLLHGKPAVVRPPLGGAPDLAPKPAVPIEAFDPSRKRIESPLMGRPSTGAILLGGASIVAIAVIVAIRPEATQVITEGPNSPGVVQGDVTYNIDSAADDIAPLVEQYAVKSQQLGETLAAFVELYRQQVLTLEDLKSRLGPEIEKKYAEKLKHEHSASQIVEGATEGVIAVRDSPGLDHLLRDKGTQAIVDALLALGSESADSVIDKYRRTAEWVYLTNDAGSTLEQLEEIRRNWPGALSSTGELLSPPTSGGPMPYDSDGLLKDLMSARAWGTRIKSVGGHELAIRVYQRKDGTWGEWQFGAPRTPSSLAGVARATLAA